MKKKILIICAGLLVVIVVGAGIFKYYVKPKYVAPLVTALEEFLLEDPETVELLIQEYEKSLLEDKALGDEIAKLDLEETLGGVTDTKQIEEVKKDIDAVPNSEGQDESVEKAEKKTDNKAVVGGKTMEELQEQVAPNDLKAGLKIASKIDTGHLLSLSKGGLTPDDKKAAKAHLQERLTSSEYSQLKGFVGKYAHLLK